MDTGSTPFNGDKEPPQLRMGSLLGGRLGNALIHANEELAPLKAHTVGLQPRRSAQSDSSVESIKSDDIDDMEEGTFPQMTVNKNGNARPNLYR